MIRIAATVLQVCGCTSQVTVPDMAVKFVVGEMAAAVWPPPLEWFIALAAGVRWPVACQRLGNRLDQSLGSHGCQVNNGVYCRPASVGDGRSVCPYLLVCHILAP